MVVSVFEFPELFTGEMGANMDFRKIFKRGQWMVAGDGLKSSSRKLPRSEIFSPI